MIGEGLQIYNFAQNMTSEEFVAIRQTFYLLHHCSWIKYMSMINLATSLCLDRDSSSPFLTCLTNKCDILISQASAVTPHP